MSVHDPASNLAGDIMMHIRVVGYGYVTPVSNIPTGSQETVADSATTGSPRVLRQCQAPEEKLGTISQPSVLTIADSGLFSVLCSRIFL